MAEVKSTAIVPLNKKNYPTWKVQCKMTLVKDSLWGIVNGSDTDPGAGDAEAQRKFLSKSDRALAVIVLSVEPSLLYLVGDPQEPKTVWEALQGHFQKKIWANRLELRRKLYSLRLKEGDPVQEHIRRMTEIFDEHWRQTLRTYPSLNLSQRDFYTKNRSRKREVKLLVMIRRSSLQITDQR